MSLLPPATQAEHQALIEGAGVADISQRDEIDIAGSDRASFLHNFCTADIKRLESGQGSEAFFLNLQGKILGHGYVFCGDSSLAIDTVQGQADALLKHLDRYLIREDVQLANRSGDVRKLLVAGKQAPQIVEQLTGASVPPPGCAQVSVQIGGLGVLLRRMEYTGPDCFVLVCAAAQAENLRDAVVAAGAVPCSSAAVEIARVEAGTPLYGRDISERNLPQEVARDDRAISFTKGCYLGQETVARIDALGHVNRRLVGLKFDGDALPEPGTAVNAAGQSVGEVTSAVWSPRLSAPLALAYVRTAQAEVGTRLESPGGAATVAALPVD